MKTAKVVASLPGKEANLRIEGVPLRREHKALESAAREVTYLDRGSFTDVGGPFTDVGVRICTKVGHSTASSSFR